MYERWLPNFLNFGLTLSIHFSNIKSFFYHKVLGKETQFLVNSKMLTCFFEPELAKGYMKDANFSFTLSRVGRNLLNGSEK